MQFNNQAISFNDIQHADSLIKSAKAQAATVANYWLKLMHPDDVKYRGRISKVEFAETTLKFYVEFICGDNYEYEEREMPMEYVLSENYKSRIDEHYKRAEAERLLELHQEALNEDSQRSKKREALAKERRDLFEKLKSEFEPDQEIK